MDSSPSSSSLIEVDDTAPSSEGEAFVFPLSFAQQRLWFLDQLVPNSSFYNISAIVRLRGSPNAAALEQSLQELVRRHEILQTTFMALEGEPVQVIAPSPPLMTIPTMDLQELPEAEREAEVGRLAAEEAQHPFDLTQGPLLRVRLMRLAEKQHALFIAMHHIVSDGWSLGILVRELAVLYETFASGEIPLLPELPIQYADFVIWQREWLQGNVVEEQLDYWKQQLADLPVLDLPTDRPRPAVQSFRGAACLCELPRWLSAALEELSRQEGATLFMTLLAAFQSLLYRYTGQPDVAVGSPIANRGQPELEGLIGFFVNTLVLRTDLSGDPSFRELLRRVREVCLKAYAHQDLPFEKLVEELQPERNLSHNPLFQVMFVLQNTPMPMLELPGLTLSLAKVNTGTAKFDLTLSIINTEQKLRVSFEYNTDLFNQATIIRLQEHFQILLESVAVDPERRLSDLPLLTETEQHQLLVEWNDTRTEYPKDVCVHQLFEAQVERMPDSVAVIFEDEALTYRELNRRVNQLAHYLQRLGTGPDVPIGICVERSLEMVVGLLGVLKAGGAYVPLDPAYPRERLTLILEDVGAPVLLTQRRLAEKLLDYGGGMVCLDTRWDSLSQECTDNPVSGVTDAHLVYILFTSGSTGTPKGVAVEHRQLLNYVYSIAERLTLSPGANFALISTFSADLGNTVLFPSLCIGGCLHVISQERAFDSHALMDYFDRHVIDYLKIVPSHLAAIQTTSAPERLMPRRCLVIGGEASRWDWVQRLQALVPDCAIVNHYGPTETTVGVLTYCVDQAQASDGFVTTPLGRPLANSQLYVLDAQLQPTPIGVPGELYIGGAGLARGYLNRQDLTTEKFIPNPFSAEPGARLYRTGDRARYLPGGNIEFLGRFDNQVKIRGFRIELGEIESVLGQHSAIRETAVLVQENKAGDQQLMAYVVADDGQEFTTRDLSCFLRERLPEYMVPSVFITLETLPLTPNGKIDRRALPSPDTSRPDVGQGFVPPRTPTEELLAGIWTQVLGIEQTGVHSNFFELGGHSLMATQVISRIGAVFQVELPIRVLFESPTIASLAERIEEMQRSEPFIAIAKGFEEVEL